MKRVREEGDRNTLRVREMADALKANGFATTPMRDVRERQAVINSPHPVETIAACLVAMRDGKFGDRYDREHLTPGWAVRRADAYLEKQKVRTPEPPANGRSAVTEMHEWLSKKAQEVPRDPRRVRPALPRPDQPL